MFRKHSIHESFYEFQITDWILKAVSTIDSFSYISQFIKKPSINMIPSFLIMIFRKDIKYRGLNIVADNELKLH